MNIKSWIVVSPFFLAAPLAFGQSDERVDILGDYSYIQFNPTLYGLQSRAFNGGGGSVQINFAKIFGIKGDFQGYGSTNWTVSYANPIVTPVGTVPAGTYSSHGNMFTYLFGPVLRLPLHRFTVFGEILFGGSNSNGYANLEKQIDAEGGYASRERHTASVHHGCWRRLGSQHQ